MTAQRASQGPVLFAYDGSELAKLAIEQAGELLGAEAGEAIVLTVWQPFNVGFVPVTGLHFDAAQAAAVERAAREASAQGAELARAAGFRADSLTVQESPPWQAILRVADDQEARLIVLGSHGRSGLAGVLVGSVAGAVAAHAHRSVLIVHRP